MDEFKADLSAVTPKTPQIVSIMADLKSGKINPFTEMTQSFELIKRLVDAGCSEIATKYANNYYHDKDPAYVAMMKNAEKNTEDAVRRFFSTVATSSSSSAIPVTGELDKTYVLTGNGTHDPISINFKTDVITPDDAQEFAEIFSRNYMHMDEEDDE